MHTKVSILLSQVFSNLSAKNPRILRQFADSKGFDKLLCKSALFCVGLRKINLSLQNQSFDLQVKIGSLLKELTELIKNMASEGLINKESESFEINAIAWLVETLKAPSCFDKGELYDLETHLSQQIDHLCENLRKEYFGKIVQFVKDQSEGKEPSLSVVEEISREFCENWKLKLANLKNEVESRFVKFNLGDKIVRNAVHGILEIYQVGFNSQKFFSEVKKVYPSFVVNMYPVHKLNADIKSIVNH